MFGWCLALLTFTDCLRLVTEIYGHASIEGIQRSFPEALIAKLISIAHDAAIDLIDLLEAALDHDRRQDFATNSAGAVGDDWLIF